MLRCWFIVDPYIDRSFRLQITIFFLVLCCVVLAHTPNAVVFDSAAVVVETK